jgi:hypothetical protein
MRFLQLLVETLLYYIACSMLARSRESAPGFLRVLITVAIVALISGGIHYWPHANYWHSGILVFIGAFFVLWIGLGIGFFRTIIAALVVSLLRMLLEYAFSPSSFV